jgi:hypothetical protein
MIEYITNNGGNILAVTMALMALAKVFVRLTPGVKDDEVFGKLDKIFEFILPNYQSQNNKDDASKPSK